MALVSLRTTLSASPVKSTRTLLQGVFRRRQDTNSSFDSLRFPFAMIGLFRIRPTRIPRISFSREGRFKISTGFMFGCELAFLYFRPSRLSGQADETRWDVLFLIGFHMKSTLSFAAPPVTVLDGSIWRFFFNTLWRFLSKILLLQSHFVHSIQTNETNDNVSTLISYERSSHK